MYVSESSPISPVLFFDRSFPAVSCLELDLFQLNSGRKKVRLLA